VLDLEVQLTGPMGTMMESLAVKAGLVDVTLPTKVASPSTELTTVI
jgi:hypothetical protein